MVIASAVITVTRVDDGAAGRVYFITPSTLVIKKGYDNVMVPESVDFAAYYRNGTSASNTAYAGRFIISESTDGSTWTDQYASSANEINTTYAPSSPDVKMIRCTLYAAGGTTSALDQQSVAIVTDVDNIDGELDNIRDTVQHNYTSATEYADQIVLNALTEYVKTGDLNSFKETVSSQFKQTAKDFTFNFSRLIERITTVEDESQSQYTELKKYIRFVEGDIVLGQENNPLILTIRNDRITFTQAGIEVAYFSNSKMYVTDLEATNSLTVGRLKFTPRDNGSIDINLV